MDKKQRLRAPNFTASDNMLLCDLVAKFQNIIENKKNDGASLKQKHAAWLEVVKIYNSNTTGCSRTLESLQQTYKNLKKKAKKSATNAKMVTPVDIQNFVLNIEEYGTSSKGWEKVTENTGVSKQDCQEMFAELAKEAATKDKILKKNVMGAGKRKLDLKIPPKTTVSEKLQKFANQKMELVVLRHELLKTQLEDVKEKIEHNRRLRVMEMDEIKKQYEHNELVRNLELEKYNNK